MSEGNQTMIEQRANKQSFDIEATLPTLAAKWYRQHPQTYSQGDTFLGRDLAQPKGNSAVKAVATVALGFIGLEGLIILRESGVQSTFKKK